MLIVAGCSLVCGGLLGNRLTPRSGSAARAPEAPQAHEPECKTPTASRARAEQRRRELAVPSAAAERGSEETEKEAEYQEQVSKEIVDVLSERFRAVSAAFPAGNPEAVADHLRLYQAGMVDGIMRTAPELAGHIAKQVEHTLCDPKAKDAQLMVMARLAGDAPELASPAGFDCIFQGRNREDIVLWAALDAWRRSGLPRTPGLDQLEQRASDSRTKNRLHPERAPAEVDDDTAVALRREP